MEETIYDLCIIGAGFFGSVAARHASGFPQLQICLIGLDEPDVRHSQIIQYIYCHVFLLKISLDITLQNTVPSIVVLGSNNSIYIIITVI